MRSVIPLRGLDGWLCAMCQTVVLPVLPHPQADVIEPESKYWHAVKGVAYCSPTCSTVGHLPLASPALYEYYELEVHRKVAEASGDEVTEENVTGRMDRLWYYDMTEADRRTINWALGTLDPIL